MQNFAICVLSFIFFFACLTVHNFLFTFFFQCNFAWFSFFAFYRWEIKQVEKVAKLQKKKNLLLQTVCNSKNQSFFTVNKNDVKSDLQVDKRKKNKTVPKWFVYIGSTFESPSKTIYLLMIRQLYFLLLLRFSIFLFLLGFFYRYNEAIRRQKGKAVTKKRKKKTMKRNHMCSIEFAY